MPIAGSVGGVMAHPDLTEEPRRAPQFTRVPQLRLNVDFPRGNAKSP